VNAEAGVRGGGGIPQVGMNLRVTFVRGYMVVNWVMW
jgi:hypothetical protein